MQHQASLLWHKQLIWTIVASILAAAAILFVWSWSDSDENVNKVELSQKGASWEMPSGHRRSPHSAYRIDEHHQPSQIPPKLAELLNLVVVEEDTGEISPRFFNYFKIEAGRRDHVKKLISQATEDFKEVEANHAEVISTPDDYYIRLAACSEESKKIFNDLREQLSYSVGIEASQSICNLLSRQFRDGGREPMEIGIVQTVQGQYLLSKRTFSSTGMEKSLVESTYLVTGQYSDLVRWRNLDHVTQVWTQSSLDQSIVPDASTESAK